MKNGMHLGAYRPGSTRVHRAPLWLKAAVVLLGSAVTLAAAHPAATGAALLLTALGYAGAGLLHELPRPLKLMWPVLLILGAFQLWQAGVWTAVTVTGNITVCALAARLLVLTVPVPVLLDGVVALVRPLRVFGTDPERFGLALALMLRSVPYLLGSASDVRDSAKARGLERNPRALAVPVVIRAVAYAQQTGDALAARGIGEPDRGGPAGTHL
ncbi:energy-coupling factor transporter transmembrane protein EcfT [Arthrobacter koreensis]|uniref:energy-coupling factor transporter transmembrane component T family protein n=1 Tax=Arthrobacter koreensis TaxID=199136 RepID=UPI002DB866C2|nr:energy-coupling factor transporter transmembrane protein EcfT [Arthrobacter koreensis]